MKIVTRVILSLLILGIKTKQKLRIVFTTLKITQLIPFNTVADLDKKRVYGKCGKKCGEKAVAV